MNSIKALFKRIWDSKPEEDDLEGHIKLATAALMIEIVVADDKTTPEERERVHDLIKTSFKLDDASVGTLITAAEEQVDDAASLHEFTGLLNKNLNYANRLDVIQNLWHVAYADSQLDKYEEYYIRKIADLLYIKHSDYIRLKLTASTR